MAVIVAACTVPVAVKFLTPSTSMLASATKALLAAAVPFVIPSSFSKSVSFISALPIIKELPAVILPDEVMAPEVIAPSTSNASSMFICDEASDFIGPLNVMPSLKNTLVESAELIVSTTTALAVTVPKVPMSFDASTTNALFAAAVPFVIPSIFSRSV